MVIRSQVGQKHISVSHSDVFEGEVDWFGKFSIGGSGKSNWDHSGHHGFNHVIWCVKEVGLK